LQAAIVGEIKKFWISMMQVYLTIYD